MNAAALAGNRGFVTLAVMLATIMQGLDTTIANVSLPHMQGSMSATQDQISWVLTSYIVAAAISMPLTGFISARLGRKRLFMFAVIGFTVASMLCGAAQNLTQIVAFRILQGLFGASLVPLSQAVLLDTHPREKHASAMAVWGVGVMVGPILGPTLGGWLTEYYSWRWVFYINLPFGILAWLGLALAVRETPIDHARRFDFMGFAFLAAGIGALQMLLDRGESLDWFASPEIITELLLAVLCLYLFLAHILTTTNPFIELRLFSDRNYSLGLICIFMVGIILFATMALLPPFLQNLLNYPVVDTGYLLAPRGIGTLFAMMLVGRLAGRVDPRYQIAFGLLLASFAMWEMTRFNLDITPWDLFRTGVTQGFGLGFVFVPMTTISFSTLAPHYRNDGTALFSLMRNLGSSIGISIVISQLSRNTQANHAALADFMDPYRFAIRQAVEMGAVQLDSASGLAVINAEVTRQAAMLAYVQDFQLMMWVGLASVPLIFLLRAPPKTVPTPPPIMAD